METAEYARSSLHAADAALVPASENGNSGASARNRSLSCRGGRGGGNASCGIPELAAPLLTLQVLEDGSGSGSGSGSDSGSGSFVVGTGAAWGGSGGVWGPSVLPCGAGAAARRVSGRAPRGEPSCAAGAAVLLLRVPGGEHELIFEAA